MMKLKKPKWYNLNNNNTGKVYIAIEFIDHTNKINTKPIFKMNKNINEYYLHLLTIGIRNINNSFKPNKKN